jgi:Sec-independent protein translocase protein TatA
MNGHANDSKPMETGSARRRRNRLFFLTLGTLAMVFAGAVPASDWLERNPGWFTAYWCLCFVLVVAILVLAIDDLSRVRKEQSRLNRQLEKELADVAAEAREAARNVREASRESGPSHE